MPRALRAITFVVNLRLSRSVRMLLVGLSMLLSACSTQSQPHGPDPWNYSTPEQQGFDSEVLVELLKRIEAENLDIHSIVLMRNDRWHAPRFSSGSKDPNKKSLRQLAD